jgi:hypothetical protein
MTLAEPRQATALPAPAAPPVARAARTMGQADVIQHYVHLRQKQCAWPVYQPVGEVGANRLLQGTSMLAMMGLSDDPALQLLSAVRFVPPSACPRPRRCPAHDHAAAHRQDPHRLPVGRPAHACRGPADARAVRAARPQPLRGVGLLLDARERPAAAPAHRAGHGPPGAPGRGGRHHRGQAHRPGRNRRAGRSAGPDQRCPAGHPGPPRRTGAGQLPRPARHVGPAGGGLDPVRPYVLPPELEPYCTERPLHVPHCYQVSDRQRAVAPRPQRSTYGLPDDAVVYCSFNNNHKFTPEVFGAWMRILQQVPGSVLWLLADNDTARENMLRQADAHGLARDRLIFAPRVAPPEYLARFQCRRPGARHLSLQRRHHRQRRAVDGHAHRHAERAQLHLAHGRQPAHGSGPARAGHHHAGRLREAGRAAGPQPARIASYKRYLAEHGRTSPLFDIPQLVRDIETQFERLALQHRAAD